jgi:hypothetical protein
MNELGLEYVNVRGRFVWPEMEPQDDEWDWSVADEAMDTVEKYGMKMIPILIGPPEHWISQNSPDLPSEFAEYCTEVVKRYKDRDGWSGIITIWNEPSVFFHDMTPEQYVKVLNAGYDAIKAVDPNTVVVGFNTVPAVFEVPFRGESIPWLESAFQHNPKFDWFGHHTYGSGSPTVSDPFISYGGEKGLTKVRAWLDERGYSDKPIYISEKGFGIMAGEDKVAQFAPECYAISQSLGANVVGHAWWNYHCAAFGDGDFGMTDRDDQPEPWRKRRVWYTYQTMIQEAKLPEYIFEAKESGEFDSLEPPWVLRFHGRENSDDKLWFMFTPWIGDQNKEPQTVTLSIDPATSATLIDWMGNKTTVFPDATGNWLGYI